MVWKSDVTLIVRGLVDDLDCTTYTNATIHSVAMHAAVLVQREVDLDVEYTIDVAKEIMTPDPDTSTPKDFDFINLISLKAACILLRGEARSASSNVIKIVDGPSAVDTKGQYDAKRQMYDDMCAEYHSYKMRYQAGGSKAGKAILGPYTRDAIAGEQRF